MSEILKLQPAEAYEKLSEGAVFIDIIDEEGFSVVAYDGVESTQVTLLQLLEKLQWMEKGPFYITGGFDEATGFKAANLLHHQGFENVGYIAGGVQAWFQDGYPVKYNVNGGCGTGDCSSGSCGTGFDEEDGTGGCGGCSCGH
ncbi:rhodanese-like domain-containing protein [Lentimicrobium sp.]|uniref:rhodanese-like domain-containing protein n=1 Tax=Lentimicrobium sp. TaxID=2034841 RepID=UPI0025DCB7DE|nr:rhodanese-like domain-containing protein [Lentimicrobium sp.]MCO5256446.1 rhodanese-like domain-containing protein [Lentimicrobium sp.]HPF63722.1 rhodanese-like domain-containing protein [Lentimicrobium sp.]HPJ63071.1 rhodanese-like domain-containing protein [Lentimicrobium sp.]HPR25144.1 rhodanese-like domain-containing protein [Lentimicrobium sp.]HRW68335.1 rhodanese-like domain-containing protein [Lentimicrobium sp.]